MVHAASNEPQHNSVLIVTTSVNTLRNLSTQEKRPTGCSIKEIAYLFEKLSRANPNLKTTLATPAGKDIPMDPTSMKENERDEIVDKFLKDENFQKMLQNTRPLKEVDGRNFGMVCFMGGPGAMLDLPEEESQIAKIVNQIYWENSGVVASIGHGLAAIVGLRISEKNNQPFLANRRATGASNEEDEAMELQDFLPFRLQDRAAENNVNFVSKPKFTPNVVIDERIVTAQNEQSTEMWIDECIESHKKTTSKPKK